MTNDLFSVTTIKAVKRLVRSWKKPVNLGQKPVQRLNRQLIFRSIAGLGQIVYCPIGFYWPVLIFAVLLKGKSY